MKLRFFTHCGAALPAVASTMKLRFFIHNGPDLTAVNGPRFIAVPLPPAMQAMSLGPRSGSRLDVALLAQ